MGLPQIVQAAYNQAGLGIRVNRAAAADAVGPTNIFTVAGGPVLVTSLIGVVTVARTGGAGVTQVFTHTAVNLCVATITGLATVGTVVALTGDPADPLAIGVGTAVANTFAPVQGSMKGSATSGIQQFGVLIGLGSITTTITVVTAGSTRYILTYIPMDDASIVNAA